MTNKVALPKIPLWIFVVIALLYLTAARVDTMDVDASQYAEMSREMMNSSNWLQLFDRGKDYLDKPPLLFWISAASMKVFGVNNFGYKLPSILLALLAIFSTYRLAKHFYGEAVGRMAALILAACQGLFLMTNDVRTDTALMGFVTTAMWLIAEGQENRKWYYILGGTAAIALGMMTKGPIALLVPLFAFGSHWVLRREWKRIFAWHHLIDMALIALFLIPMSIGLYQQFDLHPEKEMQHQVGVSGLRFFYWTQSFGRITGENDWSNGAGPEFLMVNMLWSFLPWILLLLVALGINTVGLFKQKFKLTRQQEWVSTGGFLVTYLSLCISKYQLPHYIFVAFPLAAIVVAAFVAQLYQGSYPKLFRSFKGIQKGMEVLLLMGVLALITFTFPVGWLGFALYGLSVAAWVYFCFYYGRLRQNIVWTGAISMIIVNLWLTNHFYYNLQHYQLGSMLGRYIKKENIPAKDMVHWRIDDPINSLHFYAQRVVPELRDSLVPAAEKYIVTMQRGIDTLQQLGIPYEIITQGQRFKISELTPPFLSNEKRHGALTPYYFIKLK